jgi:hypothetical protein
MGAGYAVHARLGGRSCTVIQAQAPEPQAQLAAMRLPERVGMISRQPLHLEIDAAVSPGALLGGNGTDRVQARTRVTGTLVDLAIDGAGRSVLSVEDAEVETQEGRDQVTEDLLRTGIVVDRDPQGTITRVRLPRGVRQAAAFVLKSIAYAVEWTRPSQDAVRWSATEASPEGPTDVAYSLQRAELTRRIDRVHARGANAVGDLTSRGELHGDVDLTAGRLLDVRGEWRTRTLNASGAEILQYAAGVRVEAGSLDRNVARASATALSLERLFDEWTDLDAAVVDPTAAARHADALAASMSPGEALRLLRSSDASEQGRGAAALRAMIERRPEVCAVLAKDIASAGLADRFAKMELSLLTGVGSPAAQRAIADVARAWKGSDDAVSVLGLLGEVREPTTETVDLLRAMRDDKSSPQLATTAELVLGNVAGHLADTDPVAADAIAQSFEERLRGATDPSDVSETLAALGNTHSPRILDAAEPYLQSSDAFVRRTAATALGQSPDPQATTLLEQLSTADDDPRVRAAATRALARRTAG